MTIPLSDTPGLYPSPDPDPPADAAGQRGETVKMHQYIGRRSGNRGIPEVCFCDPDDRRPGYEHFEPVVLLPEGDGAGKEKKNG